MAETLPMTSSRPYLVRALHEWISDNGMTPLMLVDAGVAGVVVPRGFVEDGKIVLNVSPNAVQGLDLGTDRICFRARFSGAVQDISVPVNAVLAIYARETSAGMMFPKSAELETATDSANASDVAATGKPLEHPHLRVIK